MSTLKAEIITNEGNKLSLRINCEDLQHSSCLNTKWSPQFKLNESLTCQIKTINIQDYDRDERDSIIFISFKKNQNDNTKYKIIFSSPELDIKNKRFQNDDATWCEIYNDIKPTSRFIHVEVRWSRVRTVTNGFESLYDDTELVDFHLKAADGSVHVHKAVLAASSPVLRRMLGGAWREAAEGCVEVPNASKATLHHLKDYIYLNKLPETGLENLMLLASFYMMTDLENRVTDKIVEAMRAESALDLLDFAFTHKLRGLQVALLQKIQDEHMVDHIQRNVKFEDQPMHDEGDKNNI